MIRRLAYVLRTFPKLSETFVAGEAAEVLRRGVDVRILSLDRSDDDLTHEIVERAGLAERAVYGRERFGAVLREFRPDLLHAHFATQGTAEAWRLAAELGVPFTFTGHRYDIYAKAPADLAERIDAAAAVVTVSRANVRHLTRTYGVSPRKLHVIPCGVDVRRFRPPPPAPRPPLVVCVARLKPIKNHGLLLEACALLAARGVPFRCVLVGDGPERANVEATCDRLALGDRVELVGAAEQADVLRWWQRASVAVLTSDYEGVPVSLMEAGACGVPAVATAVGGVPELVQDGVTGLLAPAGDADAVADRLECLLTDPRLATRLGAAARRRVEREFSVVRQVDRLLGVWNGVLMEARAA
jgi:colanic acid/amylovoran biosynthesis glycosyltransferase